MSKLYPGTSPIQQHDGVDFDDSQSGTYQTKKNAPVQLELKVDVDQLGPFSKTTDCISGVLTRKSKSIWSGNASKAYFRSYFGSGVQYDGQKIHAVIYVLLSDGGKRDGQVEISVKSSRSGLVCDVKFKIESSTVTINGAERISQYFGDVTLDIDFVEKVIWPVIRLENYAGTNASMKSRELDLFSVFKDAGLKLYFVDENSQKVEDPTPDTRWTKADMYAVMKDYFDGYKGKGFNIWCLLAQRPPDSRYMGYSFDQDGKKGFGLFTGHTSFNGMDSDDPKVKATANRRFLHYMVHECGHCLGLIHPFEDGNSDSLSWMNYAWKYDSLHGPGTFYDNFEYSFSDDELITLRHQPNKEFVNTYEVESGEKFDVLDAPKATPPDLGESDDDDENDEEVHRGGRPKSNRKISFKIKVRSQPYFKGDTVEFEAILRNSGRLPCRIDPDLSLGGGNISVYITDPLGGVQVAKPFVQEIDSPTRRYLTLGKAGSRENSDVYREIVPLIQSNRGTMFRTSGNYQINAVYEGSGMTIPSDTAEVTIEDDREDDASKDEARISISVDGSLSDSQKQVMDFWMSLMKKPIQAKLKRIQMITQLLRGINNGGVKVTGKKDALRSRKKHLKIERSQPLRSARDLILDTTDIAQYFKRNYDDDLVDDLHYVNFVLTRGKILCGMEDFNQADLEYNQLVADLLSGSADFDFMKRTANKWESIRNPSASSETLSGNYQERVEKLIDWMPEEEIVNEEDKSGLGLGLPFNNFDDRHLHLAFKFAEDLEKMEDNTDDIDAVLDYAEGVMKSLEVNTGVCKWALETFIVHSKLAKKHRIRYPDPPKRDPKMTSMAAIVETKRVGKPEESWMHYWRCDADFNYHHRHWHAVYRGVRSFNLKERNARQGELFGYMHTQMLARYDADRESWGLDPVAPYAFSEKEPHGFDAGWEFHEARSHREFAPRPSGETWTSNFKNNLEDCEKALQHYFKIGELPTRSGGNVKIDTNVAGHIIEATSDEWGHIFGSFHNEGHMAFCYTKNIPRGKTTYMGSSLTAVRDPIFFRWHKRVDNLYQEFNDTIKQEVSEDAPGVVIHPEDVVILPGTEAPDGFHEFKGSGWKNKNFKSGQIQTYLRKPTLAFEWDNKLDHEPFSYHIRIARKPGVEGVLPLTVRVFICQERHVNNRRSWIEMDKFVHVMQENETHSVLKRLDKESSVIKRLKEDVIKSKETQFVPTVPGNCECGWPYSMLLPRGIKGGEKWVLGVFISDNKHDGIKLTTSCGSMSYCGTRDLDYPDSRTMGYPFSMPICIGKNLVKITEAAEKLTNFSLSPFQINNDFEMEKLPIDVQSPSQNNMVWAPYRMVGSTGIGIYNKSRLTGRFRVRLDDKDFRKMSSSRIRIRFAGRPDSSYNMSDVRIGLRKGNTIDIDTRCNLPVTFNTANGVVVTKDGVTSDEIFLPVKTGKGNDYFVTFTLKSPGCYVHSPAKKATVSIYIPMSAAKEATNQDQWTTLKPLIGKRYRSLYCVQCVVE
ncbi:unnamed protein product [Clavelina lepadiformis]|uniref:Tyrosinase copper-binding domain-containing protein n=2 Tax=Clavelina lepadiformis TaxID=159417 RepID=A0ABP0GW87_CLALP